MTVVIIFLFTSICIKPVELSESEVSSIGCSVLDTTAVAPFVLSTFVYHSFALIGIDKEYRGDERF